MISILLYVSLLCFLSLVFKFLLGMCCIGDEQDEVY